MRTDEFVLELKAVLEAATSKDWGISQPPSDVPDTPYGVIHLVPSTGMMPGFETMAWMNVNIQISCVGITPQQCLWLRHGAMAAMIGDGAQPVTVGSESASMVMMTNAGGISDSGHSLWSTEDTYRFAIPVSS